MERLTKIEKETIVLFNEGEDKANIYTHNAGLKKRLAAFAKKYPDLCRLEKSNVQGGVSYELAKSRLSASCRLTVRNADRKPANMRKSMG